MGGGIAYQSALKGVPIKMKDIAQDGLDLGLAEANKLLAKRVARGRMTPDKMGEVLNSIDPMLSYEGFKDVDIVVEAVVENPKVKHIVLAETEEQIRDDAILASNTSTISIDFLAEALEASGKLLRHALFQPGACHAPGRGYSRREDLRRGHRPHRGLRQPHGQEGRGGQQLPGLPGEPRALPLLRRLLQAAARWRGLSGRRQGHGALGLAHGPAYLSDVVGIDTGVHAAGVMAEGFPDRMKMDFKTATEVMFENDRLGQKNGKGFYDYVPDKRGKPKKTVTQDSYELIAPVVAERREFEREEIIARMMLPMCTELARCLEEGIVGSAAEADLALLYGIGFPPFRGGVFRWMDTVGLAHIAEQSEKYADLGKAYELTDGMRACWPTAKPTTER
jgi:3-hydroxyacyl-CoA dehydrogenase/enoyl-CoA hydratase/3-hydroxybutyryl-CoA epimerase/enoyl-CoA isomerase